MEENLKLVIQSAQSCLNEALSALDTAYNQAERHERLGEVTPISTDIIERAANAVRTAQRTLDSAEKSRR